LHIAAYYLLSRIHVFALFGITAVPQLLVSLSSSRVGIFGGRLMVLRFNNRDTRNATLQSYWGLGFVASTHQRIISPVKEGKSAPKAEFALS
jgi:hypothetical protein